MFLKIACLTSLLLPLSCTDSGKKSELKSLDEVKELSFNEETGVYQISCSDGSTQIATIDQLEDPDMVSDGICDGSNPFKLEVMGSNAILKLNDNIIRNFSNYSSSGISSKFAYLTDTDGNTELFHYKRKQIYIEPKPKSIQLTTNFAVLTYSKSYSAIYNKDGYDVKKFSSSDATIGVSENFAAMMDNDDKYAEIFNKNGNRIKGWQNTETIQLSTNFAAVMNSSKYSEIYNKYGNLIRASENTTSIQLTTNFAAVSDSDEHSEIFLKSGEQIVDVKKAKSIQLSKNFAVVTDYYNITYFFLRNGLLLGPWSELKSIKLWTNFAGVIDSYNGGAIFDISGRTLSSWEEVASISCDEASAPCIIDHVDGSKSFYPEPQ